MTKAQLTKEAALFVLLVLILAVVFFTCGDTRANMIYEWQCTNCYEQGHNVYSQFTFVDGAFNDEYATLGEIVSFGLQVDNHAAVREWDLQFDNVLTHDPNHWAIVGDAHLLSGIGLRNDYGDFVPLGWFFDNDTQRSSLATSVKAHNLSISDHTTDLRIYAVNGTYARRWDVGTINTPTDGIENVATPEPSSIVLMLIGLVLTCVWKRSFGRLVRKR